ncbi:MAG: 30S ribosomal protein S15 [Candidatus Thermoplasmatota archaeon]|nr:30S ribosomal protein S15 [Candidatus Thermoplasmatota archaeon]MCL5983914.1 30S ribosomal protein S15 [Candidatus Thermoplasmatota archaeon]
MSRIHSSRKGRAGSHRPYPATKPAWVSQTREEVVEQAVSLSKTGLTAAQVGQRLRDSYGVPSVRAVTGERMTDLLKAQGIQTELPEDLQALLKRVVHLQRHLQTHPKDLANQRGLSLIESRIRRLARYYRDHKVLPETWRYSAAGAALQVE